MKFRKTRLKEIHFDDIQNLTVNELMMGILLSKIIPYEKKVQNEFPFIFRLTYRVSVDKIDKFSYIGEFEVIAINENEIIDKEQIKRLLIDLKVNYDMHWEDKTPEIGQSLPSISEVNLTMLCDEIAEKMAAH